MTFVDLAFTLGFFYDQSKAGKANMVIHKK